MSVAGFRFAGLSAGIKKVHKPDLGAIVADAPAAAAAVFTTNRVRAAPVQLAEERLARGRCQAVLANSGCANACTGPAGLDDAVATTAALSGALGIAEALVVPASTGVIGARLPREKIETAVPELVARLAPEGAEVFADAILTTDRARKIAQRTASLGGCAVAVQGIAKGAGMIAPNLATTLCFVVTDVAAEPRVLLRTLREAADRTFNTITVDGDTSTNDIILLMASGRAGNRPLSAQSARFTEALAGVLDQLGRAIVADGEGATKLVTIRVTGASDAKSARAVARRVAQSPLVKAAIFGQDPNWGRILAAAGAAGVAFDPNRVSLTIGEVAIVRGGVGLGAAAEERARAVMRQHEYEIVLSLGRGRGAASCVTCDLTLDYVRINADYRS